MNPELAASIEYIEKERGIEKQVLVDALKQALLSACRKTYGEQEGMDIAIDPNTYSIRLLREGKEVNDPDFGRIAAQTAKQVIIQKIREAERESIFDKYIKRKGDIVTGTVHRVEKKAIFIDLGKTEGILPAREQSPSDEYRQGYVARTFVVEVKKTSKGPEIILSRADAGLVQRLFELEVPEIHDGIVEIKAAAREAGSRTKIAVFSSDDKIDCVGSCVGIRGQRVKNIVQELGGEKIDIIRYSEDVETYIKNAMAPAELSEIHLNRNEQSAEIIVQDDQLSLAIGKKGQNVRLASKLLGWKLDVRSMSQKVPIASLEGMTPEIEAALKEKNITVVKDLLKVSSEELVKMVTVSQEIAETIVRSAHQVIIDKGEKSSLKPASEKMPAPQAETKKAEVVDEKQKEEAPAEKTEAEPKKDKKEQE